MISTFDRSYADDILPDKLEKYMKELEIDVEINMQNIHEKVLTRSSLAAKWGRFYYEELTFKKNIEKSIDDLKEEIAKKLFEKKKASLMNQNFNETLMKIEAEKILKKTSAYIKLKKDLDDQDDIIRYINEAKQIISQLSFDLKNAIDELKLEG